MARKPQLFANETNTIRAVISEPFAGIFSKMFDKDEQLAWLAPCDPVFDHDMATVILKPKTIFAHDWIIRNFASRLTTCCPWKIIHPATRKSSGDDLKSTPAPEISPYSRFQEGAARVVAESALRRVSGPDG